MDEIDMRLAIEVATEEALTIADELANTAVLSAESPAAFKLAGDFQQKRAEIRRLRRALKAEVAG